MDENAKFCPKCGTSLTETETAQVKLHLADWGSRFIAWLIDIIIVGLIPNALNRLGFGAGFHIWPFFSLGSTIPFLYWFIVEGYSGRSIGKLVMNLKVTKLDGSKIDFAQAAIESFGKAFLLPIDCIIGWILESCKEKRQRLFNKLSNTIVVRAPKEEVEPKGVEYVQD